MKETFYITAALLTLATLISSYYWPPATWFFALLIPVILLGFYDIKQKKHTVLRLYPVLGHFRFMFEAVRPEIQQYFVEDNINGTPVNREFRSLIYQRAKGMPDTRPFGTQFDVYRVGYEWMNHSMNPQPVSQKNPRVTFGCDQCSQPYQASLFNISAMSYGALSQHAILALNLGAKLGNFFQNTGEGGLTPYHLREGGDLVWQIGTGYFSCRTKEGAFDANMFAKNAKHDAVKMIEIKISQGAKPGHGGILPAAKVTEEIARIRHVPMGQNIVSPPGHTAFTTPTELLEFIQKLRNLANGKPVGFKISMGKPEDFIAICKAMQQTQIYPDFITVDGGEGGTGSAPIEFTNSIGTPLREAVNIVHSALIGFGVREQIKIIASGKAFSSFHVYRLLALGADTVNSARGMMFALGCIQSRSCNTDKCPTGIATQDPSRYKFLDICDKGHRVSNYQSSVMYHLMHMIAAAGLKSPEEIQLKDINRRISATEIKNYAEIYPTIEEGCLLQENTVPNDWKATWQLADASKW